MTLQTVSAAKAFGGTQGVYTHMSATTGTPMTFSVYVPRMTMARCSRWSGICRG